MNAPRQISEEEELRACLNTLWHRGELGYLLHSGQREIRDQFNDADGRIFVLCCSRRWGKSRLAAVMAVQAALSTPNADIKYAAPTAKMAREIVVPHMQEILADCPESLAPEFNKTELKWRFPNGSQVTLAGCDNGNASRLRGTSMTLGLVDEAGFMEDLHHTIQSVLMPQALTTGGRIFMLSTPARSPAHDFTRFCIEAKAQERYAHRTIYDAPHIPPHVVEEFKAEVGGEDTSDWRREFLAETVIDEEAAVIPEFTRERDHIVTDDMPRPDYFVTYTVGDLGFHDLTAILFAFHDFPSNLICVEDELVSHRTDSGEVMEAVKAKERALWGDKEVYLRVADCDEMLRRDLVVKHGVSWSAPRKDDKHAAVNALRLNVRNHRLRIHSRCVALIAHLEAATWNKARTKFERAAGFGHFDAVDAMVYLNRSVRTHVNPFPRFTDGETHATHWINPEPPSANEHALRAAFGSRRR